MHNVEQQLELFVSGQHYYLNVYTKESQWDRPDKAADPASAGNGKNEGPDEVQCSHILVKHAGSRRPSSWREQTVTRSKAEALELIKCKFVRFEQKGERSKLFLGHQCRIAFPEIFIGCNCLLTNNFNSSIHEEVC